MQHKGNTVIRTFQIFWQLFFEKLPKAAPVAERNFLNLPTKKYFYLKFGCFVIPITFVKKSKLWQRKHT